MYERDCGVTVPSWPDDEGLQSDFAQGGDPGEAGVGAGVDVVD